MINTSHILIFLPFILLIGQVEGTKEAKTRDPRLFYVSTTTSTTTLLTATICFMTTNAALTTACGKRRKRFANDFVPLDGNIDPSRLSNIDVESVDEEADYDSVISDSKNSVEESKREGRFLVYWLTTTSLSTFSSYTATWTIGSLVCTPSDYTMNEC